MRAVDGKGYGPGSLWSAYANVMATPGAPFTVCHGMPYPSAHVPQSACRMWSAFMFAM